MSAAQPAAASGPIDLKDEKQVRELLGKTVLNLWDVVNELTRLRPARHEHYRVTIFGSARARPGSFAYQEVKRLAAALSGMGCEIITGGGPGLMQAANEGAVEAPGGGSMGIRVDLPFEQHVNPFVAQAYEHKTFFTRLHHFVLASDAFVVVPGGIGTVLELMMVWQLLQVKHVGEAPLILVGKMWDGLLDWSRSALLSTDPPLANSQDMEIPRRVDTADEAIALLRDFHAEWQAAAKT